MTSRAHPDLATLLSDPERVHELPAEMVPIMLTQLAAEQDRLSAIERRLLARLITDATRNGSHGDRLLTLEEAARLLASSEDWLSRNNSTLPFTVRLSPGQVRYSFLGIQRFIETHKVR